MKEQLSFSHEHRLIAIAQLVTIIVVDDIVNRPILLDPTSFSAAIHLTKRQNLVVCIGQNEPLTFHQIEGVARTAYAKNDNLRLATIHSSVGLLEKSSSSVVLSTFPALSAAYQIYVHPTQNVSIENLGQQCCRSPTIASQRQVESCDRRTE